MKNFNQIITETVCLWLENEESYYWQIKEFVEEDYKNGLDEFIREDLLLDELNYNDNPLLYDIVETALSYVDWNEVAERFEEE